MKAFTDISQSKKLAEILPLKSADMTLPFRHTKDNKYLPGCVIARNYTDVYNEMIVLPGMDKEEVCKLIQPCWSLAALFSALPEYIKFDGHTWKFYNDHYGVYYMNADTYDTNTFSTNSENPVDAAFEMIIKLHEQKFL